MPGPNPMDSSLETPRRRSVGMIADVGEHCRLHSATDSRTMCENLSKISAADPCEMRFFPRSGAGSIERRAPHGRRMDASCAHWNGCRTPPHEASERRRGRTDAPDTPPCASADPIISPAATKQHWTILMRGTLADPFRSSYV